jgi:hypothetical protein
MEGIKMRTIIVLATIFITSTSFGKSVFLNKMYGQIHQNESRFSRVITTFECGQPFSLKGELGDPFSRVTYATYEGYILTEHLSNKKPTDCWQDKYRKFFEFLGLGVTEMHYLGRLEDLLIRGSVMP